MDEYINRIGDNLNNFFISLPENIQKTEKIACLISGGIDSSTIAFFVKKYFPKAMFFSFGTKDNFDLPFAKILKDYLNLNFHFLELNKKLISDNIDKVKTILAQKKIKPSLTQISLGLGYYLIFKYISTFKIKFVFTGQGPDILLGGYHKYKNLPIPQLNKEIEKDIPALEIDKKRDQAMADIFGVKLFNPYLSDRFIELSKQIPAKYKILKKGDRIIEKFILREFAKTITLPQEIINRPKKAFQYSSRIQKMIKK